MTSKLTREENVQAVFDLKAGYTLGLADVEILKRVARMALAAMDSESGCLPLDYLQGHKDGLEWAARLAEANHPDTGDWLYDDPIELAKAIRKGPDMPPAQPVEDSEPDRNPVLAYADSYRDMAKQGVQSVPIWSVITDLERNIAPLYRHAQQPVVPDYPETLPCPVLLELGLRFGKGVKTRLVLDAIQRRAEHSAELEAMTPEERAEYDAGIEEFKAMLPQPAQPAQPAPVVPDESYQQLSDLYHAQEKRLFKIAQRIKGSAFDKYSHSPSQAIDVLEAAIFGDNDACRAAMLQAQSEDDDGEPTDDERIMAIEGIHNCERCSDGGWVIGEMGITRCACGQADSSPVIPGAEQRIADAVELLQKAAPAMLADNSGSDGPLAGRMKSPVIPDAWIPVSERMPDDSSDVLCTAEFDGPGDWRRKVGYWHEGKWVVYGASWMPTHWMPLPAAPQEVKGE
ncbi:DUF551 domain-containing protein [Klebsiella michiganensis]|uniref:DUF551 domain-containing protein n=1 Tax=Klebsiella michiganensis TaxID=1134687 RepID=UPI001D0EE2C2|nr:DUF551 domain-containing protein [Klebsiella michiganensis]